MVDFLANICKKKPTKQQQPNAIFSAARKFDSKAANLLLKIAQKRATLKNRFKSGFKKSCFDFILEPIPNLFKTGSK